MRTARANTRDLYNAAISEISASRLFTKEDVAKYKGQGKGAYSQLYLVCMGKIFDVSSNKETYGTYCFVLYSSTSMLFSVHFTQPIQPINKQIQKKAGKSGGYNAFIGQDATRFFVTGDFDKPAEDDIDDFNEEDMAAVVGWREFYENHHTYEYVGKLIGRYYDVHGNPTDLVRKAEKMTAEKRAKEAAEAEKNGPPEVLCNVSWRKSEGGSVSCHEGYPRRVVDTATSDEDDVVHEKCVCFETQDVSASRKLYEGCQMDSRECQTSLPEEDIEV